MYCKGVTGRSWLWDTLKVAARSHFGVEYFRCDSTEHSNKNQISISIDYIRAKVCKIESCCHTRRLAVHLAQIKSRRVKLHLNAITSPFVLSDSLSY